MRSPTAGGGGTSRAGLPISSNMSSEFAKRLRASEELMRRVLAASPDCIKVMSLDARLEFFSEGGLCAMEVDDFDRQLKGADWLSFWADDDRPSAQAAIEAALAGNTGRFTAFCPTAKGTPKWWDVSVTPILSATGVPDKLLSISRDVTSQKMTEAALTSRAARQKLLADTAASLLDAADQGEVLARFVRDAPADLGLDVVLAYDADESGRALCLTFGHGVDAVTEAALKHLPYGELLCGRVASERRRAVVAEIGASSDSGCEACKSIGLRAYAGFPLLGSAGELLGVLSFGSRSRAAFGDDDVALLAALADIVAALRRRLKGQAALAASEALLSAVLDALPLGVVLAAPDGELLRHNAANLELWGMPPETGSWQDYSEWVGWWPETGKRIAADEWAMSRVLLHGETVRGELIECQRFDNAERRFILNNAAPVRGADGRLLGGVAVQQDVTELRRTQQALTEALEAKETLLGEVNHRVKNSLQIVTSLLMLQARTVADADARRAIEQAQARVAAVGRLHQQLYEGGTHGSLDFADHARSLLADTLASTGMADRVVGGVRAEGDATLPLEKAVPLAMIASELVTNAVKYAFADGRHGAITLDIDADGEDLTLTVSDDGIGMDASVAGAGFGTRIVAALTRQLQGRVEMLSQSRGTAVRIVVPRS